MDVNYPTNLFVAALAGQIQLSEDCDELFAAPGQKPAKGYTAMLRNSYGARLYARGSTPTAALRTLHEIVLDATPSAESVAALSRLVGEPRRATDLPVGLL